MSRDNELVEDGTIEDEATAENLSWNNGVLREALQEIVNHIHLADKENAAGNPGAAIPCYEMALVGCCEVIPMLLIEKRYTVVGDYLIHSGKLLQNIVNLKRELDKTTERESFLDLIGGPVVADEV